MNEDCDRQENVWYKQQYQLSKNHHFIIILVENLDPNNDKDS